jgi:signal transduction histidine kinase
MVSVFLLLNISWYTNRGMGIGIVLMFYTAVVIAQLLIQEKYRWWLTGGYSLNMLVILLWEGWSNQFFILGLYPNVSEFPLITKGIFIFITFSVTSWVIIFIKRQYDEAYQLTRQQQEELLFKNKRISNINTELEEKIEQRTQELMQHHEQLLGYAFFHSHDLRAPITNLLTIHEALCLEDLEAGEQNNLIQKLQQETENLDEKIRDVQSMLENRNHSLDHL